MRTDTSFRFMYCKPPMNFPTINHCRRPPDIQFFLGQKYTIGYFHSLRPSKSNDRLFLHASIVSPCIHVYTRVYECLLLFRCHRLRFSNLGLMFEIVQIGPALPADSIPVVEEILLPTFPTDSMNFYHVRLSRNGGFFIDIIESTPN